jgi:hypothetical protein
MEREDEGQKAVETGCRGGQGSPRAVAPTGRRTHRTHIRCPAIDIYEQHRKHNLLYCCIYSTLHRNGIYPIVACVFVVAYCYRRYLATGCLSRICLHGNVFTESLPSNRSTCHNINKIILNLLKCSTRAQSRLN